jgi:hypothetical protein
MESPSQRINQYPRAKGRKCMSSINNKGNARPKYETNQK